MSKIIDLLKKRILIYDGAMGTMLQKMGLRPGVCPEEWNILCPEKVLSVHKEYVCAGADVVEANTFGGNRLALAKYGLEKKLYEINYNAVKNAGKSGAFVAASVGPLPEMVSPLGRLSFDEAKNIFKEQIAALNDAKPDLIIFETFSDIKELKIAVIAAREVTAGLPIQAQLTFDIGGATLSGTTPEVAAAVAEGLGVEIIGVNCSLGPKELLPVVKRLAKYVSSDRFISVLPNAGLPEIKGNETVYPLTPDEMAVYSKRFIDLGVNIFGGCCGTQPDHIAAISRKIKQLKPKKRNVKINYLRAASRTRVVGFISKNSPYVIGERINPSRRKDLIDELHSGGSKLIRENAVSQVQSGAHMLDINISTPGIDEVKTMTRVVNIVQNSVDAPLVIDSSDPEVLESGIKECSGIPIINSVNGEEDKLKKVLPLAKKYGANVIALTLDENGIPMKLRNRIRIAEKIIKKAGQMGIPASRILIDFLTLSIAAQPGSAKITLSALRQAKKKEWQTVLGVSNVSFGLPNRQEINQTFLSMAKKAGLTSAIVNPLNLKIREDRQSRKMLLSKKTIIIQEVTQTEKSKKERAKKTIAEVLRNCILTGDKDNITGYIEEALNEGRDPLIINQDILMPALIDVGNKYDRKEYFLPQLLLSAEAMQKAVARLELAFPKGFNEGRAKILMATVKGDLHDIGKNIVCAVLKNHGYTIIDLGRDVPPEKIIETITKAHVDLIGLSALMTTTMKQMEIVIQEIRKNNLSVPVIIGGAVVNDSYAQKIGAIGYAKDAVNAVNVVKRVLGKVK